MRAFLNILIILLCLKIICCKEGEKFVVKRTKSLYHYADISNWQFMTVLTFGRFVFCTGALIRPFWVLSTSSCFKKNETKTLRETFGPLYARVGPREVIFMDWNIISIKNISSVSYAPTVNYEDLILVEKYFTHPTFIPHITTANMNDVGLCKLLRPGTSTMPPMPRTPISRNSTCATATYKSFARSDSDARIPGHLTEFIGKPYNLQSCIDKVRKLGNHTHPVYNEVMDDKFCLSLGNVTSVKELNQFSLNGAPIVCDDELKGVSCVLTVEGKQGKASIYHEYIEVYTDVNYHRDWIDKVLRENGDEGISGEEKPPEPELRSSGDHQNPTFLILFSLLLTIINNFI